MTGVCRVRKEKEVEKYEIRGRGGELEQGSRAVGQ